MKNLYNYRIFVQPDERTGTNEPAYTVYVPTLELATDGDSESEAITNAQEAVEALLGTLIAAGEAIPKPDSGSYRVHLARVKVNNGRLAASPRP